MIPDDFDPYAETGPKATQGRSPSGAWSKQEHIPVAEGPPQGVIPPERVKELAKQPEPLPTDLELKANVDSLDLLQHKRRILVERIARLEYLFGGGRKTEEAMRKQHRDGILRLVAAETKETAQGKLESLANSDARHRAFTDSLEGRFVEWFQLKNEIQELNERIDSRLEELRCFRKEAGLT